jgi:hypothetical protein
MLVAHILRMYRYFKPKGDGSPKCSKEAMELYQSDTGSVLVASIHMNVYGLYISHMHACEPKEPN